MSESAAAQCGLCRRHKPCRCDDALAEISALSEQLYEPTFSLGASIAGAAAMVLLGPPAVAWALYVASTDEDAHVNAWHAHRDVEFQRDFNKRKRVVRRPFNRT